MSFTLRRTAVAEEQYAAIVGDAGKLKILTAVQKCLGFLQVNPRHPGLNSHKFDSLVGAGGEEVFEVYAQNQTPGAYRVFWHYGPGKNVLTIIAITPHP